MLDPRFQTCLLAARRGSLTQAARELYLSTQAVKKQLDSVEEELGFPLFIRSTRGLTPTEAGEQFLSGLEQLSTQYHRLATHCRHRFQNAQHLTLTLLLPSHPKIYFENAILTYNRLYPHVQLDFVDTRKLSVLYDDRARLRTLEEGTTDVVFAPRSHPFDCNRLVFHKLTRRTYHCIMKPDHPLSGKDRITREDLAAFTVRINTVMDRVVYDHIIDQDPSLLPERIVYSEKEYFSVQQIISFCLNGGVYISKGDFLETLHPMMAIPFDPPFAMDNGLFCRTDAPEHVRDFIDLVCRDAGVTP